MAIGKHPGGRPPLTEAQKAERKEYLLIKIEAYLKSGLSVNKALREAKIYNSEFYKYMAEDEFFGEKIEKFRQYPSVLANHIIVRELMNIVAKQSGNKANNIMPQPLSQQDIKFLRWFALNSNACFEEWGRRHNVISFDPEIELQRLEQLISTMVEERFSQRRFV